MRQTADGLEYSPIEKDEESKISGEPGRTRTCNPLFATEMLCS
jgi:hypothetical protein